MKRIRENKALNSSIIVPRYIHTDRRGNSIEEIIVKWVS